MISDYPLPWPLVPLRAVAQLIRGVSFAGEEVQDSCRPNYFPVLRAGNISDRLIIDSDLQWIPESRISADQRLQIGDIAICMSSGSAAVVGKTAALEQEWDGCVGAFCAIIRPSGYIDPRYLAAYLRASQFTQWRKNQAQGANIQNLRGSELLVVPIPLPPMSEQQRIVAILQEAEEIRRLRAAADAKTAELLPSMFDAVFGAPSGWKVRPKLGELVRIVGGGTPSRNIEHFYSGHIPWATSKDIKKLYLDDTEEHVTEEAVQSSATNVVPKGTVLVVVKSKILAHTLPIAITQVPMCFGQDIKGMIPASGITPEFLVYSLQAQLGRILSRARGANTEGLTLEALKSLDMPKPLPELVERFRIACAEIRGITDATILGNRICVQTTISLSAHAFSGHLTSDWREAHMDNLAFESRERDATLKQAGAVISLARQSMPPEAEVDLAPGTEPLRASLNREQLALLNYIIDWVKAKDNESGEEGKRPRYFTAESIGKALDGPLRRNPHAIEGHLAVFAARGLVIPVSREEQTENTGEYVFGNAYRLPNGARQVVFKAKNGQPIALESGKDFIEDPTMGDRSRTREMERLVIQLEKERALT